MWLAAGGIDKTEAESACRRYVLRGRDMRRGLIWGLVGYASYSLVQSPMVMAQALSSTPLQLSITTSPDSRRSGPI